eukprot:m.163413 g.163413  ORF g.163413 m.163413 type:complete len:236 (-) comp18101_c0_seq11:146-853(-)
MEYEMKEKIAERAYDEAGKGDYPDPFTWAVFRDKEHGIPKMFMICFVFLGAIVTVATKPKQICSGRSGETVKYSDFDGISFLLAMFFVLFFHEIIMLTLNFTIGLNRLTKLGCTAQHNDGTIVYSLCSWWAIEISAHASYLLLIFFASIIGAIGIKKKNDDLKSLVNDPSCGYSDGGLEFAVAWGFLLSFFILPVFIYLYYKRLKVDHGIPQNPCKLIGSGGNSNSNSADTVHEV